MLKPLSWVRQPEQRIFLILLLLALLIRIPFIITPGFQADYQIYMNWADTFLHHSAHLYTTSTVFPINYPPLTIYIFALMIKLYSVVRPLGVDAATMSLVSRSFDAFTKLPLLFIELSMTTGIYWLGQRVATHRVALISAAAYAFSPVIIYTGVQWGQTDGYIMLFSLLAGCLAWRKHGFWAGIAVGFGIMSKAQFIFLTPVIFVYLFRWAGWKKMLIAFGGVITMFIIAFLPAITNPVIQIQSWIHSTTLDLNAATMLSPAGYNFWWLIGHQSTPYRSAIIPFLSYQLLGYLIFTTAILVICVGILFSPTLKRLFLGMALSYFTFFCFMPGVLERYSLPVLTLVLVAAFFDKRLWRVYILVTVTAFLNTYIVVLNYPVSHIADTIQAFKTHFGNTSLWDTVFDNGALRQLVATHPFVLQLISAGNVIAWLYLAGIYGMEMWQDIRIPALPIMTTANIMAPSGDVEATTAMRRVVLPLQMPSSDDAFWIPLTSGVNALRNGNLWGASRQLQRLHVDVNVLPNAQAIASAYLEVLDSQRTTTSNTPAWPTALTDQLRGTLAGIIAGRNAPSEIITKHTLSVVLPAYNEEQVIADTVRHCLAVACRFCPNIEVIVVNDGSRDHTRAIIDALTAEDASVVAIHHPINRGYGAAVLTGFNAARGELLFFMDSDGQFTFEDIVRLLPFADAAPTHVFLGIRQQRQDSPERRLNAWLWKQLVWLVIGLRGVTDIDCAFKLLPTKLVQACDITAQGAMINTELLVKLQRMHVSMIQVPVRHFPRMHGTATGANLKVIFRALLELFTIQNRLQSWDVPKITEQHHDLGEVAQSIHEQKHRSAVPTPQVSNRYQ